MEHEGANERILVNGRVVRNIFVGLSLGFMVLIFAGYVSAASGAIAAMPAIPALAAVAVIASLTPPLVYGVVRRRKNQN